VANSNTFAGFGLAPSSHAAHRDLLDYSSFITTTQGVGGSHSCSKLSICTRQGFAGVSLMLASEDASPVTAKRTLIIARTLAEAADHALVNALENWQFVVGVQDVIGADPATHNLAFAGEWYERTDLKGLRQKVCGRGFNRPLLRQIPSIQLWVLSL
jgi:hypothetical protein